MGQILPGVVVAFENPKGGVGKSTLTALFAGYIHSQSNEEGGLSVAVVDIDDMQNTIGKLREDEAEDGNMKKEEEYEVINISSSEFINQLDFLQDNYDIILVDFPGNLKQNGVIETLHFIDVVIIPFEPNQTDLRPTLAFYNNIYVGIMETRRQNEIKGYLPSLRKQCRMAMWMYLAVEDGKSGRMPERKLMLPFLEMEICWLLWQEMQDIRSSGLLQMISGRWKVQQTGSFFMITILPNVTLQ